MSLKVKKKQACHRYLLPVRQLGGGPEKERK